MNPENIRLKRNCSKVYFISGKIQNAGTLDSLSTFFPNADLINLEPDSRLQEPVRTHADLVFGLYGSFAVIRSYTLSACQKDLSGLLYFERDIQLFISEKENIPFYPGDCGLCAAYGCFEGKEYLICNPDICDSLLYGLALKHSYEIIPVKQGYARCSCAVLSDGAVITEDAGIKKALDRHGIPVLLLNSHYALLPGYDYGFIGGCTGRYGNKLYFNGCIENHPEYSEILKFASEHSTELVSMGTYRLTDIGSFYII